MPILHGENYLHVSAIMVPNPWWSLEWFLSGVPKSPKYTRLGKGQTYTCRDGQLRGKAAKKTYKRLQRDPA